MQDLHEFGWSDSARLSMNSELLGDLVAFRPARTGFVIFDALHFSGYLRSTGFFFVASAPNSPVSEFCLDFLANTRAVH